MTLTEQVQKKKNEFGWWWVRSEHRMEPVPALFHEIEKILGCELDEDYREFVSAVGGGAFDTKVDIVDELEPNPWGGLLIDVFLGFYNTSSVYDVRNTARDFKYQLPPFFVPLAHDPGANLAVYAAAGEHKGKVYFRDKSHREFAAKHNMTDVYNELEARGMETRRMDIAQAIIAWETLHATELPKPPRFGNLYLLATSLGDFIDRIRKYEGEAIAGAEVT